MCVSVCICLKWVAKLWEHLITTLLNLHFQDTVTSFSSFQSVSANIGTMPRVLRQKYLFASRLFLKFMGGNVSSSAKHTQCARPHLMNTDSEAEVLGFQEVCLTFLFITEINVGRSKIRQVWVTASCKRKGLGSLLVLLHCEMCMVTSSHSQGYSPSCRGAGAHLYCYSYFYDYIISSSDNESHLHRIV